MKHMMTKATIPPIFIQPGAVLRSWVVSCWMPAATKAEAAVRGDVVVDVEALVGLVGRVLDAAAAAGRGEGGVVLPWPAVEGAGAVRGG